MRNTATEMDEVRTLGEAVDRSAMILRSAGIAEARREARWLIASALQLPAGTMIAQPETALAIDQRHRLADWLARRACHEPLGRIAGIRSFYGRDFVLSPETLEPRADSETVVAAVLGIVRDHFGSSQKLRLLDVGTGTGCLLITLLAELPQATGMGSDISAGALECAAQNARVHGVADRVKWKQARSLEGIEASIDVLVSNPPYIATSEIDQLEPEVRLFDPRAALDGGADGLDVYREIAQGVRRVVPDGFVVLEVGRGQHQQVGEILKNGLRPSDRPDLKAYRDLAGHVRCVTMRTHSERQV